ncbi:MAG: tryptophan synthase subunit alpha [Chloroflexi bacterium]|nr:tryptophan synthase subunit alpha [Chloroflexota bacterium]
MISKAIQSNNNTAVIPFITCGFPDVENFVDLLIALEKSGSSVIEIGMPNSDPLAEGLTIQYSSTVALNNGVNTKVCLQIVKKAREKGLKIPVVLMGYYNNVIAYDIEKFCNEAKESGVDGLIIADLPVFESKTLVDYLKKYDLSYIPLLSVNSSKSVIEEACKLATGYVYCISVLGVTGERKVVFDRVKILVEQVRNYTSVPVAVGFGVSNKSDIAEIGKFADGAIIGSALINKIRETKDDNIVDVAGKFISSLI